MIEQNQAFVIHKEALPFLNMSLYLNGIKFIHLLSIENECETDSGEIQIGISSDIPCIEPFSYLISSVPAKTQMRIPLENLKVNRDFLNRISESEKANIRIEVVQGNCVLVSDSFIITIQPLEHFGGFNVLPQLIASFVTPNHPYVYYVKRKAIAILENQGLKTAFEGYQSGDKERVLQIMSALFTAIQNEELIYSSLPPGYEETGQRLRLLNTIQKEKFANCIDISLLFAASLEAADLHPLLIIVKGHIFVGCWLNDDKFSEVVNEDKTAITKRISKGIREIAVIEATSMCKGTNIGFSNAVSLGEAELIEKENFLLSIDIKSARAIFIRPLPLMNSDELKLDMEQVDKPAHSMENTFEIGQIYQDELLNGNQPKTKQKIWERKLLDLSLRNSLLNIRLSKNMLQIIDIDINILEDILWDGKSFSILPHPNAVPSGKYNIFLPQLHSSSPEFKIASDELKYNRLLTYYHQKDLDSILTYIYKNAKQAIEENGSSTLFLALGLLQWYDRKTPQQVRFAPILLLPVEISRRSVSSKFTLRSREEETMINITLLEFLRQEYQLNLSGLEQLPQDEKGVDVAKVMGIIRRAIMQMPGWDVKEQLVLGNFSFSKLILWNDIVIHQDKLLESDMVRSLVEGRLSANKNLQDVQEDFEVLNSSELTLPISTDVSQMDAVRAAQKGLSFVLHGPPGTGKSQTITNIIADALYRGNRVLFVAAKKAALDVVYKRLKQIGLEPFTLELHSNKSKKSDVLNQLALSLETLKHGQPENFEAESQRLDATKKSISEYVNLLHKKQQAGWSLYNSLTDLEKYRNEHLFKSFIPNDVLSNLDEGLWQKWNDWLPQFDSIIQLIVHPLENPLAALTINQYSISFEGELKGYIEKILPVLTEMGRQFTLIPKSIEFPFSLQTRKEVENFYQFVISIDLLPNVPLQFALYLSDNENYQVYEKWSKTFQDYQFNLKNILSAYNRTILDIDVNSLETLWNRANQSFFLSRWFKKKNIKKQLSSHRKQEVKSDNEVEELFGLYKQLDDAKRQLQQTHFNELKDSLKNLFKEEETDIPDIESKAIVLKKISNTLEEWGYHSLKKWLQVLLDKRISYSNEVKSGNSSMMNQYRVTFEKFIQLEKEIHRLSGYKFSEDSGWLEQNVLQLHKIQSDLPHLKNWINYKRICETGEDLGLDWLIKSYENKECSNVTSYFHFTTNLSLARQVIGENESLNLFNAGLFENKIEQYKQIANEYKKLTVQELRGKLAAQLPNATSEAIQSSEPGILQRAIRSKGRGMSIRKLFDQIPNLLPRLSPCMLMSPISVAQYFDVDKNHFDLLIFDEASQLPTCEAISSLARARQAIIVGDPKQMPPTSFFTTNKLDEENIEIEDLESILDDCLSLSVPSKYLLRHYRSRHESLIAFSNANYYENKLLTFPSADDLQRKVQYHHVPGFYDKGKTRTNKFEADAIVQFIKAHYNDTQRKKYSLGIVTFSQTQQSLIEEKLEQLYSMNHELEEAANSGEEPLFVKNLENVQGDERDIILFSVGYAADDSGKMIMNFGPLNRNGGWRRLNVAVTRARFEMYVFATLKADDIDLSRTSAEGVANLKAFLSFAQNGQLVISQQTVGKELTGQQLSEFVSSRLKEKGLDTKCNIGKSGFKVDVGVVHPEKPHEFILGIIIDGYYYYHAKTSNDREIVMPSVLKSLGWNLYRIWSLNWHENSEKIIEEILIRVKNLQEKHEEADSVFKMDEKSILEEPVRFIPDSTINPKSTSLQKPYIPIALTPVAFANSETIFEFSNRDVLRRQIQSVLDVESPISKSLLYKRILIGWNISRAGSRLDKFLEDVISDMNIEQVIHNQPFYFNSKDELPLQNYRSNNIEKRKAEDIAPEEILVALQEVVGNHLSIDEEELVRYLGRIFDFSRLGRQVESQLRYTIEMAVRKGSVKREGSRIKIAA